MAGNSKMFPPLSRQPEQLIVYRRQVLRELRPKQARTPATVSRGVAMPLASTTHRAIGDLEDISLTMLDGENTVRVDVQRNLLVTVGRLRQNSPAQQLAILEEHRDHIEQVASAKYDKGDYHRYANGRVVRITLGDWERYRPEEKVAGDTRTGLVGSIA